MPGPAHGAIKQIVDRRAAITVGVAVLHRPVDAHVNISVIAERLAYAITMVLLPSHRGWENHPS